MTKAQEYETDSIKRGRRTCLRCGLIMPMQFTSTWICSCGFHRRHPNGDTNQLQYAISPADRWTDVPDGCLCVMESRYDG